MTLIEPNLDEAQHYLSIIDPESSIKLGAAAARGKPIGLMIGETVQPCVRDDMWFVEQSATRVFKGCPKEGFDEFLKLAARGRLQ